VVVKDSEWRNAAPERKYFGIVDSFGKAECGGGFRINSESYGCLRGTPRPLGDMSSSWCGSNFEHYIKLL